MRPVRICIYGGTDLQVTPTDFISALAYKILDSMSAVIVTGGFRHLNKNPNAISTDVAALRGAQRYAAKHEIDLKDCYSFSLDRMSDNNADFEAEKREIVAKEDSYRERHHDTKLSLYSGFFAFEGLTLAAAAVLSSHVATRAVVVLVLVLALLSCVILFFQYHLLLTFYDRMGYSSVRLRSPADLKQVL